MTSSASADGGEPDHRHTVVASLRRTWWLVGLGLAATLAVAAVLPSLDNRAYQARASLFLVDATAGRSAGGGSANPYLHGNDSLVTTAELLAGAMEADADARRASGVDHAILEVAVPRRPPAPLLHLVVTADSPGVATTAVDAAVESARRRLAEMQARGDVGVDRQVTVLEVYGNTPRQAQSGKIRPTIGILFLGTLLTVVAALALDHHRHREPVEPGHGDDRGPEPLRRTPVAVP
jgi:hypothetical protein